MEEIGGNEWRVGAGVTFSIPFESFWSSLPWLQFLCPYMPLQSIELILTKPRSCFQFKSLYRRSRFWMTHCRLLCVWSCRPCHASYLVSKWARQTWNGFDMFWSCLCHSQGCESNKGLRPFNLSCEADAVACFVCQSVFRHWIGINFMPLLGFCAHARWSSREEALKCI